MEYNKKEELFDKITGLKYMRQGVPRNWYNKGVDDSFKYIKISLIKRLYLKYLSM